MKIDKAIEILTLMGTPSFQGHTEDILEARKLGIEAMKRVETFREQHLFQAWILLPGETKE